ncbi:unnamed protein product [Auanema sp. JU1783]|nr:unnamed protein product [Auanema sp. JU1783]
MKHSPQWTQNDKLGDGNSRERRPSGASSNQSLNCRQRKGPKEYSNRIFESGRHSSRASRISEGESHRLQHLPYDPHQNSEHMTQAQSVPVDVEFLQRPQWPGNNVRQTSHRSHSATNRTINVNGKTRDIDRDRDSCRRTPNPESTIKLENKKQGGPVTYIAAGTAPVASFRSTVSPVPTSVVSSPSSGGYANSVHSMKRPITFSPSLSVEDSKCDPVAYRKHKFSGIDLGKGTIFNHDPRNNRYGGQKDKRNQLFYQGAPGNLSRVLAEIDIQQALDRMSPITDDNSKDVNWMDRQTEAARVPFPLPGGLKQNHRQGPKLGVFTCFRCLYIEGSPMPSSAGSSDSGCPGLLSNFENTLCDHCSEPTSPSSFGTDEDEPLFETYYPPEHSKNSRINKNRRQRENNAICQDSSSISSSNSEANSVLSEEDRRVTISLDDVVHHIYVYFQSLLIVIRSQQKFFQHIDGLVADGDARWGACDHRNGWRSDPSGLWAVPHPAVHLSIIITIIQDYLNFLTRLHPSLAPRTNIPPNHLSNGHEDSNILAGSRMSRNSSGDMILPEEMMPMLMRIVQTQALPQMPLEESASRDDNSTLNPTNSWTGMAPAMMHQIASVLSHQVQAQSGTHSNPSVSTPATPVRQNYSTVVAGNSHSSVNNPSVDHGKTAPVAYSVKAASQPKGNSKREEKAAIAPILLPLVSDRESKRSDDKSLKVLTGDTGESGYQSENSPPVASIKPRFGPTASIPSGSKLSDLSEVPTGAESARSSVSSKPLSPPPSAPLNTAGHFEVSKMDVLSEEIWHYHNSVTQTDAMLNQKLHLRDLLYYSICPVFPMCGLYVVGSSLNGFGNNSSDMDLCLMITNKDLDQKTDAVVVLNMILNALSQLEWVASQKLILAKVPILRIKFSAPFSDITVDLNANNSVAIKNTHLLCYYSSFDWRVRPLVSVVKEWAKRKGINDANRSSFTSYSLVLMVIHYLQCGADPPVLPSLQQMYPKMFSPKCDVRTLNVTQALPAPTDDWEYSDKCTLGELLIGFLDYYANKFNYDRDAISVRQGKRVDRASLARHKPAGMSNVGSWRSQWRCICIEEPFTLSNTAHSIYDEMVFGAIKNAFREAHVELEQSRDLQKLLNCKSITVNAPMGGAVVYSTSYDGTRTILSEASPSPPTSQPNMSLMPSGSANSLNTAQSGSSASSSNGDEPDEHPSNERLPSLNAGIIIRRPAGNRHSGRRRHTRKSAEVSTTQMAACRT